MLVQVLFWGAGDGAGAFLQHWWQGAWGHAVWGAGAGGAGRGRVFVKLTAGVLGATQFAVIGLVFRYLGSVLVYCFCWFVWQVAMTTVQLVVYALVIGDLKETGLSSCLRGLLRLV